MGFVDIKMDIDQMEVVLTLPKKEQKQFMKILRLREEGLPPNIECSTKVLMLYDSVKKGIKKKRPKTVINTKKSLEERKKEFYNSLIPYVSKYGKDVVRKFFDWYSEHNEDGLKMRFEKYDPFNVGQRMARFKNEGKPINGSMPNKYDQKYEQSLNSNELPKYWQHLRSLGWKKKQTNTGRSVWIKPK